MQNKDDNYCSLTFIIVRLSEAESERAEKSSCFKEDYSFIRQRLIEHQPFIQSTSTGCLLGVNCHAEDTEVTKPSPCHPALSDARM